VMSTLNLPFLLSFTALAIGNANCPAIPSASAAEGYTLQYHQARVISGNGTGPGQFADELRALAVDSADRLYAVGDSKVAVFSAAGEFQKTWTTARPGLSAAIAADGTVYVGEEGQIELFDPVGKLRDTWRDAEHLGAVTAIGLTGESILIGDAKARCIRRLDRHGKYIRDIGKDNKLGGFSIPNGQVDLVIDSAGVIHAPNPGRHRVERYTLDGKLVGTFGRFDGQDPAGFTGCCNPTNIALTPNGQLVTAEKANPRVKVYDVEGRLLALMGTQDFDPNCVNMDIAVDSRGRIYVADTVRLQIVVFEPESSAATTQPASAPLVRESPLAPPRPPVSAPASAPSPPEVKP
jgi:hypothetical protein